MSPQVKEPWAAALSSLPGEKGWSLFITGSGGQQAEVANNANQCLTDAPCHRFGSSRSAGGHGRLSSGLRRQ